jgi:hypothetical protein
MRRIIVICEGQPEEAFIRQVLVPPFLGKGVHLQGITVNTSPSHKGGALSYDRLRRAARNALASGDPVAVTTLIDLYKLDTKFPGFDAASAQTNLQMRLQALEAALHTNVVEFSGCDPARFIPHIQPHEFEALLFSDVQALVAVEAGWSHAMAALTAIRAQVATPEDINQGYSTKPSSRLETLLRSPGYRKLRHGPIAAERVGLTRMAQECPHFARSLARLWAL